MIELKYTFGPWEMEDDRDDEMSIRIRCGPHSIAVVPNKFGPGQERWDEAHANAMLMAAAPDLLETLLLVLDTPGLEVPEDLRGEIWDVVFKAVGSDPGWKSD